MEEDTVKKAIVDFAVVCYLLLKVKLWKWRALEVTMEKTCQRAALKQNTVNNDTWDLLILQDREARLGSVENTPNFKDMFEELRSKWHTEISIIQDIHLTDAFVQSDDKCFQSSQEKI